jgi:hypothetical protein
MAVKNKPAPAEVGSELEQEFIKALGIKEQGKKEARQAFLDRIGKACSDDEVLTEEVYEGLSPEAQEWWGDAAGLINQKKPVPEFPDAVGPEEKEVETEGEVEEQEEVEAEGEEQEEVEASAEEEGEEDVSDTDEEKESKVVAASTGNAKKAVSKAVIGKGSKSNGATRGGAKADKQAKPVKAAAEPAAKSNGVGRPSPIAGMAIKPGTGGPREGTLRAAILKTLLKCATVEAALSKTVTFDGEEHPINTGNLRWQAEQGYIKLIGAGKR